ncbi:hypothetical protein [Neptuniibacter halophilus]|uniref:hypothetical protein n=1 Tax=Neptuniibacter halophilus TaxID=651666 RepID=UPI0025723AEB|nr:hypothetical protein [Neptuniibacter halophilus]
MRKFIAGLLLLPVAPLWAETLPADPTRPAPGIYQSAAAVKAQQIFTLNGLTTGKQRNSAVVNGQQVVVGDRVDGALVLAIDTAGVTLATGSGEQFIAAGERKGFSKVKRGE